MFLQSPDTMASIAVWTLRDMRLGGAASVPDGGLSSTASVRLAGVPGGVIFSMIAHYRRWPGRRNALNVTFSKWPLHEPMKALSRVRSPFGGALAQGAVMPDEFDWDFSGPDDAKAVIRAAVRYLLEGAAGSDRGDIVREIIGIVDEVARGLPHGQPDPFDDELPGG
jgi:hypothetical protein